MLSYAASMPNIQSAKKALRGSMKKRQYNSFWKNRVKSALKTLKNNLETKKAGVDILNKDLTVLQKVLDKASKKNVIHKNKANRLKSRYAKKVSAQTEQTQSATSAQEAKSKSRSTTKTKRVSKS